MPKYWGKQIFTHGRFPEVGQKQKTEKNKRERLNDGNNNGQAMHGARKPPGPKGEKLQELGFYLYPGIAFDEGRLFGCGRVNQP